jgi:hypothetical protein
VHRLATPHRPYVDQVISRRPTRELPSPTETAHDADKRCTTVAIDGIAVIDIGSGVAIRADGQQMRVSFGQALAIASAILELTRRTR